MKFILFVEGHTEKKALSGFLKRWIDPRLEQRVGLQVVRFKGWPELIKDSPKKAKMYLNDNDVIAVFALLDLYGPTIYPDDKQSASERYEWAKKHLEKKWMITGSINILLFMKLKRGCSAIRISFRQLSRMLYPLERKILKRLILINPHQNF